MSKKLKKYMSEQVKEEEKKEDTTEKQLERCIPVARQVMKEIADSGVEIGNLKAEEVDAKFNAVRTSCLKAMLDANLLVNDVSMVLALILQPFELTCKGVESAFQMTLKQAAEKKWGKPSGEITLQEIDEILKS
jgi:hypothetical protein